jgi:hypothetical protein
MNSSFLLSDGVLGTAFALMVSGMQGKRSVSAVIHGFGLLLFTLCVHNH